MGSGIGGCRWGPRDCGVLLGVWVRRWLVVSFFFSSDASVAPRVVCPFNGGNRLTVAAYRML